MLLVVGKKLDLMNPAELSQGHITEWVATAICADRDVMDIVAKSNNDEKQGEFCFAPECNGV